MSCKRSSSIAQQTQSKYHEDTAAKNDKTNSKLIQKKFSIQLRKALLISLRKTQEKYDQDLLKVNQKPHHFTTSRDFGSSNYRPEHRNVNKRAYIFPDIVASADYHPALTAELNSGPPALQIAKKNKTKKTLWGKKTRLS